MGTTPTPSWFGEKTNLLSHVLEQGLTIDIPTYILDAEKAPHYSHTMGIALETGIWYNLSLMDALHYTEEQRLWVIAREVAHFQLHHETCKQTIRFFIRVNGRATVILPLALYIIGLSKISWLASMAPWKQCILGGIIAGLADHYAHTIMHRDLATLDSCIKDFDMHADITAARMLCLAGMQDVVTARITLLRDAEQQQGPGPWLMAEHATLPALEANYLELFLETWHFDHEQHTTVKQQ